MEIEIYNLEEVNASEASQMAADSTAIELHEKLGLVGQSKFTNVGTATRAAYPRMTLMESKVYGLLFPEKTKVEAFDAEIIPVRVLEELAKAKEIGTFLKFMVWHSATRKDDPILVAVTGTPNPQTWDASYINETGMFLIARWGKALLPFDTLVGQAKKKWLAQKRSSLSKEIREKTGELADLEVTAEAEFATGNEA